MDPASSLVGSQWTRERVEQLERREHRVADYAIQLEQRVLKVELGLNAQIADYALQLEQRLEKLENGKQGSTEAATSQKCPNNVGRLELQLWSLARPPARQVYGDLPANSDLRVIEVKQQECGKYASQLEERVKKLELMRSANVEQKIVERQCEQTQLQECASKLEKKLEVLALAVGATPNLEQDLVVASGQLACSNGAEQHRLNECASQRLQPLVEARLRPTVDPADNAALQQRLDEMTSRCNQAVSSHSALVDEHAALNSAHAALLGEHGALKDRVHTLVPRDQYDAVLLESQSRVSLKDHEAVVAELQGLKSEQKEFVSIQEYESLRSEQDRLFSSHSAAHQKMEASLAAHEAALGTSQRKLQKMTDSHTYVSAENIILKTTVQQSLKDQQILTKELEAAVTDRDAFIEESRKLREEFEMRGQDSPLSQPPSQSSSIPSRRLGLSARPPSPRLSSSPRGSSPGSDWREAMGYSGPSRARRVPQRQSSGASGGNTSPRGLQTAPSAYYQRSLTPPGRYTRGDLSSATSPQAEAASAAANAAASRQQIHVLSSSSKVRSCTIMDSTDEMLKIHYNGFDDRFDEWLQKSSDRIHARIPWIG